MGDAHLLLCLPLRIGRSRVVDSKFSTERFLFMIHSLARAALVCSSRTTLALRSFSRWEAFCRWEGVQSPAKTVTLACHLQHCLPNGSAQASKEDVRAQSLHCYDSLSDNNRAHVHGWALGELKVRLKSERIQHTSSGSPAFWRWSSALFKSWPCSGIRSLTFPTREMSCRKPYARVYFEQTDT